ncbi:hypothetical protein Bbelb_122120 [Branchiostoma belcheri]|nr:hypothetical protein Bbelb_122120 [Branchiostoma belcheri]
MSTIVRISGMPLLMLAVCLSVILSGVSAQSTTPRVAVVSPVVDGQQSSAVPQTPAAGAASTAQATEAPQGATTLPPAASNVTNPPATTAPDDRVCRSNPNPMPGEFVMQCEDDGSFSTKQCHGSTGLCYCAHPQDGTIYQETARRGEMEHDCATYWQTKGTGGSVLDIVRGQNTGAVVVAAIACILMLGIIVFVIYGEARGINIPYRYRVVLDVSTKQDALQESHRLDNSRRNRGIRTGVWFAVQSISSSQEYILHRLMPHLVTGFTR